MSGDTRFLGALRSLGDGDLLQRSLNGLIEQANFGVYVDHPVEGCIYANQALLDQFNLPWDEFRGFGWARTIHPDDLERVQAAIRHYEHTLEPFRMSYRVTGHPGQARWVQAEANAMLDASGAHVGSVCVTTDVTAQQDYAARTAKSQKLEAVGSLAGRIAHDFNNLLSAIYASASVIAPEVKTEAGVDCLEAIEAAVESAQQVTNHLLSLSRHKVRGGRPCCPDSELEQLEPLLRRTLGESIVLDVVGSCGATWVPLDPGNFSQVVINLAVNARDAMPEGGALAVVTRRDGDRLILELQDSGHGISPEVMKQVFEPFFSTKDPDHGTGLGLSTVRDLVHLAGGKVSLLCEPGGRGTLARVTLPVLDLRPEDEAGPNEVLLRRANGARVLLVDDHDALRQSLSYALAMYGFHVTATRNLREARERLAVERPDALVLDVLLPDGRGVELLRELRETDTSLPVVLTSGYVGKVSDSLEDQVVDPLVSYLPKPVRPRDLVRLLGEFLAPPE